MSLLSKLLPEPVKELITNNYFVDLQQRAPN